MTTIEAEHAFTVYCEGKSSVDLYELACRENDVRPNTDLLRTLPDTKNRFDIESLDVSGNYLGPAGVHCLLDLIRANKQMLRLNLSGQGADDVTVNAIVAAIRNHERLGVIDLSNNPEVTVETSDVLIKLMRDNKMTVNINVRGTAMGAATQRLLDKVGRENDMLEANFFKGDFIRLKRTFSELDTEGNGRISVSALLTQIEIPQVANALEKRFAMVDDGGVTDGQLDMSEFLRFTYPGFQNIKRLREHMNREDKDDETIVENWKVIVEALRKGRMEFPGLHLIRLFHRAITLDEAVALLRRTLELMWEEADETLMSDEGKTILRPTTVMAAVKDMFGKELDEVEEERRRTWEAMHLGPEYVRLLAIAFGAAHGSNHVATDNDGTLFDVALSDLLEQSERIVTTETMKLGTAVPKMKLLAAGIGGSIRFTFPEWVCYVNEARNLCMYPICKPKSFSVEAALGNSPVQNDDDQPPEQ